MQSASFREIANVLICIAFVGMFFISHQARAEDTHSIVVLSMGKIMTGSDAVKSVNQQAVKLQEADRKEIKRVEAEMRNERTQLRQQKTILSKEQYERKVADFTKRAQQTRLKFDRRIKSLRAAKSSALGKIRKAITPIVEKIVNERNIHMVVAKIEVLFAKKELDITDTVLVELNRTLKTVKVDVRKTTIE